MRVPLNRLARDFALFMNWFDGICATFCGAWMALSGVIALPLSWSDWMPVELLEPLPLPDFMTTSFLWAGIALALVNGLPNIIALALRLKGNRAASYAWGIAAGMLLICWTAFELVYIPNGLSVFYLILGILQALASWHALKVEAHTAREQ